MSEDESREIRILRKVAGRLGLDVDGYTARSDEARLLGAVGEWADGGPYSERGQGPVVTGDDLHDVLPDYQASATREWVWVSPGDRSHEGGSWALGRTTGGVGIFIEHGDGDRPADVHEPAHLAAAILSALRHEGPS